jgi:hypothetical protein
MRNVIGGAGDFDEPGHMADAVGVTQGLFGGRHPPEGPG